MSSSVMGTYLGVNDPKMYSIRTKGKASVNTKAIHAANEMTNSRDWHTHTTNNIKLPQMQ